MHTYTRTCTHTCHTCTHTRALTQPHTHAVHTHMHSSTHTTTHTTCTCTHACTQPRTHTSHTTRNHTHTHTHNSYISLMEQHEPEGRMLFCLGNVTNLLDVTPSNQLLHHYHLQPFHFVLFKVKNLVAKQHPTHTRTHIHTSRT